MKLEIILDTSQMELLSRAFAELPDMVRRDSKAFLVGATALLAGEASERTPRKTGMLANSIAEGHYVKEIPGGMLGVAGTAVNYAVPVELGIRPGPVTATSVKGKTFTYNHPGRDGRFMYTHALAANKAQIEKEFAAMVARLADRLSGGRK